MTQQPDIDRTLSELERTHAETFAEPWQAQAFAMVIKLFEQGVFDWSEWTDTLSEEIRSAGARGEADRGDTYYQHWLAALEVLLLRKAVLERKILDSRIEQWRRAYLNTPHGQPIELAAGAQPKI